MRITLSDARASPVAAALLLVGVVAAVVAVVFGDGDFGAPVGSPQFLAGIGFAALAVVVTVAYGRHS